MRRKNNIIKNLLGNIKTNVIEFKDMLIENKNLRKGVFGVLAATILSTSIFGKGCSNDNDIVNYEYEEYSYDTANAPLPWGEFVAPGEENSEKKSVRKVFITNNSLPSEFRECVESGEDFILIVRPTGYTYAEIYDTIDVVKSIVDCYNINYPILYDISALMEDNVLTANVKLGKAFCDKLSVNNCYVGLYGNDSDMVKYAKRFSERISNGNIDNYDKLIVTNGNSISYDGVYNMSQIGDNDIIFKYDLKKVIVDNNLNESDKFIDDYVYVVNAGDTASDIAKRWGIKVNDLLAYNNLSDDSYLVTGDKLIIPNYYDVSVEESYVNNTNTEASVQIVNEDNNVEVLDESISAGVSTNETVEDSVSEVVETPVSDVILEVPEVGISEQEVSLSGNGVCEDSSLEEVVTDNNSSEFPLMGCDLSYANTVYDWEELDRNFDYVILRTSQGKKLDENYVEYADVCNERGIPIGVYCFNGVRGIDYTDNEEFRKALYEQANYCLSIIKDDKITYPVYFDFEVYNGENIREIFTVEQVGIALDVWRDVIKNADYTLGLYCNKDGYKYVCENYDVSDFETWVSGGQYYDTVINIDDVQAPSRSYTYSHKEYSADMYQSYQAVTDSGAANHLGRVDVDFCYTDYIDDSEDVKVRVR